MAKKQKRRFYSFRLNLAQIRIFCGLFRVFSPSSSIAERATCAPFTRPCAPQSENRATMSPRDGDEKQLYAGVNASKDFQSWASSNPRERLEADRVAIFCEENGPPAATMPDK
jgi:hypothetical protein